jgi:hypothetical protein
MGRTHPRIIGAVAAVLAAGLAGFSLRSQQRSPTTVRNPAADVRTVVIRRTIHIVRHEHPKRGTGPHGPTLIAAAGVSHAAGPAVRTGASSSHAIGSGAVVAAGGSGAVTTRTSAAHLSSGPAPGTPGSTGAPVTTRTSAGHSTTGSSARSGGRLTTRTSSHGASGSRSGTVTTRSSGGRGEGGDGGGDHGD